jgi:hypothetical protein
MVGIRRRDFITLLGGAAVWPLAVSAQQAGKIPLVGYLSPGSSTAELARDEAFRQGLRELGYIEGRTSSSSTGSRKGNSSDFPVSPRSWCGSTSTSSSRW